MKSFALLAILLFSTAVNATTCALIGDSISDGVGVAIPQNRFAHLLQAENDIVIKDLSSPGAALGALPSNGFNATNIRGQLSALTGMFRQLDCIIIQAGTNDYGGNVPLEDTQSSLTRIIVWARNNGAEVLVLEPIWRANESVPNKQGRPLDHYRYGMYITCFVQNPDVCKFAFRNTTVMGTAAGAAYYAEGEGGQLHPNDAGHRHLANWIKAQGHAVGYF